MKLKRFLFFFIMISGNLGAVTRISLTQLEKLEELITAGYKSYADGFSDSAHAIFRRVIELDTTLADGYYHDGCIYAKEKKDSIAIDNLVKAVKKNFVFITYRWILEDDSDWDHLRNTVLWQKVKNALRNKIKNLKQTGGVDRKFAFVEIARIYSTMGDTDSALKYISLAIESGFADYGFIKTNPDFSEIPFDKIKRFIEERSRWTGTVEQKLWGLMLVHSEVKYRCANLKLGEFNSWDEQVRKFIPAVIKAKTREEYYWTLKRLVASINDNHTFVEMPPDLRENFIIPPIEFIGFKGKVFVKSVFSNELSRRGLKPGAEVVEVNGIPVQQYLKKFLYPYISHKPEQFLEWFGAKNLLIGKKGTTVKVKFRKINGDTMTVEVERIPYKKKNKPFVEMREIGYGIVYFNLKTFSSEKVLKEFLNKFDTLELEKVKGIIIDIRQNGGGNSGIGDKIIAHFIDHAIENYQGNFTPVYIGNFSKLNFLEIYLDLGVKFIKPAKDKVFTGPLVILTSPNTCSAGEDFVRPLKESGRATIIGMPTCGGTGNPYYVNLPGGGYLRVCVNSEPFAGKGIRPDIVIYPTQKDIAEGRDPVLKKAINFLKGKISKNMKP